ncbi:MAG TPA: S9 family peptidase [Woeseiaceae bacterium]|nr:S9 family peptidase [Woeseiaceae bacterium]
MSITRMLTAAVLPLLITAVFAAEEPSEKRPLQPQDFARLLGVRDPQIAPDGAWVAYTVHSVNLDENKNDSDIWMVSWDGTEHVQLTFTPESESSPRWSPDGRWLAFLSSRTQGEDKSSSDDEQGTQLWLLDRRGGEARRVTEVAGDIEDYAWSPDGTRLVLVMHDPEPEHTLDEEEETAPENPPEDKSTEPPDSADHDDPVPIVIDRYHFKSDEDGWLEHRRDHLYLFDLATKQLDQLTGGDFDDANPAWSPDGERIAFTSKRVGEDPDRSNNIDVFVIDAQPGEEPHQLTTWIGPDEGPLAWSPDGRWIAYRQGSEPRFYAYSQGLLALVPAAGGEPRILTEALDRDVSEGWFSPDGRSLYFLVVDDRSVYAARVPTAGGEIEKLAPAERTLYSLSVSQNGHIAATLTTPDRPAEIYAFEDGRYRQLSHHNDEFMAGIELGTVRGVAYTTKDGNEVHAVLYEPVGYHAGRRYPALLRIHGGPNGQNGYEFDFERQLFAGAGYVVLSPNYRGSAGRGRAWKESIFADWGHYGVVDNLAGADYLVEQGIADPDRLGIGGWSYGCILTDYSIATTTRFSAATCGAGSALQLAMYGVDQYTMQYDIELGHPWENPDLWIKVSYPFFHADRITTPTLYLGGTEDFNVPLVGGQQMYQALRTLNVPTQLVIYPGQHHGIRLPSFVLDRYRRYLDWYAQYLGSGDRADPAAAAGASQ